MADTFKYETEGFTPGPQSLTDWLNKRGEKGWELVHFREIPATPSYDAVNYRMVWMLRSSTRTET